MATHNSAVIIGYLTRDPKIQNEGRSGEEKIFLYLRTIRQGKGEPREEDYQEVLAMYDEEGPMLKRMKKLKRFDVLLIKGVFNMVNAGKPHRCPSCRAINLKERGSFPFIRPIVFYRLNNLEGSYEVDTNLPDRVLAEHYRDFSNILWILGTVCSVPQMIGTEEHPVCRYKLGVDRKYYVRTQPETKSDYPWVYSYGEQAKKDFATLEPGSVVFVSGYFHTENAQVPTICGTCGESYRYPDVVMSLVPYYVGYLNYKTETQKRFENTLQSEGMSQEEISEAVRKTKFGHNFQMPFRNCAMMTGYLTEDPKIMNEGVPGRELVQMSLCTIRRDAEDVGKNRYSWIDVFCDGPEELLGKMKELKQFDLILLTGGFRVLTVQGAASCPNCGEKTKLPLYIYCVCPSSILKFDNVENSFLWDNDLPDIILSNHYREIGNFMWFTGTIVDDPELSGTERHPVCTYDVNSSPDGKEDGSVPVQVLSYGEHALSDSQHLEKGSGIFIDGFFQSCEEQLPVECSSCGTSFACRTKQIRFIPYSTEYLDYITDEDIAKRGG